MAQPATEWVKVTGDQVIIAREPGDVWVLSLNDMEEKFLPFAKPMSCAGALGSTVGLLDGAISLGFEHINSENGRRSPNLIRYVYSIVGVYFTSRDTCRNLLRAAERFMELGRTEVAEYLADSLVFDVGAEHASQARFSKH